jgi:hypothetical protein
MKGSVSNWKCFFLDLYSNVNRCSLELLPTRAVCVKREYQPQDRRETGEGVGVITTGTIEYRLLSPSYDRDGGSVPV